MRGTRGSAGCHADRRGPPARGVGLVQENSSTDAAPAGRQGSVAPDRPVGELVTQLAEQVSRLVREELRRAQVEMAQKGKRAGLGVGMFGGGGVVALYGIAALLAAIVLALARVMPAWAAALVVAAVLLAVAGGLALVGRRQIQHAAPPVPEEAISSVKTDVEEIKERARK
jgi:uncharacterized membrane protein YqjE